MIRYFAIFFIFFIVPLTLAFGAVENFTTNKLLYHNDDQLNISGNVLYDPKFPFVTIQVFTPGKSNFAEVDVVPVNADGSFSSVLHVGGLPGLLMVIIQLSLHITEKWKNP